MKVLLNIRANKDRPYIEWNIHSSGFKCPANVPLVPLAQCSQTNAVIGFKHVLILQTITIIPMTSTFGGFLWTWLSGYVLGIFILFFPFGRKRVRCCAAKSVLDSRIWTRLVWVFKAIFSWSLVSEFFVCHVHFEHTKKKETTRKVFNQYFGLYFRTGHNVLGARASQSNQ